MPLDDILRQVASRDPLLAAPNVAYLDLTTTRDVAYFDLTTTRVDTPRMAVTPTPPPPEPPPAIPIGSEVPPPPPPTAVEVATTATTRFRASLARLRALHELRRLHREQGPRRCHSCGYEGPVLTDGYDAPNRVIWGRCPGCHTPLGPLRIVNLIDAPPGLRTLHE